jgi:4-hydroxybenzoate polyprenyltransferase
MTKPSRPRLHDYLELVRLPNVFTAMADVAMGLLFVRADKGPQPDWVMGLLIAASSLLYMSGVVLNDVFDLARDTEERPERPLPSGRVSPAAAMRLGWALLLVGAALPVGAALLLQNVKPVAVGALLAASIVVYNALLKRTVLGPILMGACRMLNVLLGMSVLADPLRAEHWVVAGGIGVYIVGVTWLSRTETATSKRPGVALAALVMLSGIALLGSLPHWTEDIVPLLQAEPWRWHVLMGMLGLLIGWRWIWALMEPWPSRVQMAVGHSILSLVMLDAAACFAVRDVAAAVTILFLLIPAMFTQRWIAST